MGLYPWFLLRTFVREDGAKLEVGVDSNGWVSVGMRNAILAQNIYCAKPNLDPDAHSGSQVRKVLGDQAPWITLKYNLVTAIVIRPLTQNVTCEMGLSIFVSMSQLKATSATSTSLPIIPSTERENGENNLYWL